MAGLMKAAQMVAIGQPVQVREVPIPELGDEDVLVGIARLSFNGGGTHLLAGDFRVSPESMPEVRLPMTIGRGGCGVVVKVGPRAKGVSVGDRVSIHSSKRCGQCIYCQTNRAFLCQSKDSRGWLTYKADPQFARYKDGCASEYALAHYSHLEKLPDGISFDVGANLNNLTVPYLAAKRARLGHGDTVVITGATGCTGAAAVLVARLFSPKKIIAVARDRKKLESLRSVDPGVIETISVVEEDLSRRLLDLTGGAGADVLLDFIPKGVETTRQAIYRMRLGGRVVLAGGCTEDLQISYRFLMRSALDFTGSRGNDYFDFPVISDFIESGRLDLSPLAIYNFPLHQVDKVVTLLTERSGDRPFWVNLIPNPDLG